MTVEEVIERRLREAREELKRIRQYRYALVNDVLDQAVDGDEGDCAVRAA